MLINFLAFATLLSAVLVITSKNPVIAIIFLIFTFVNAALYLILSGIIFIGISYIIIYLGAITVIFLFVIMMINIKLTDIVERSTEYTKSLPLAVAIGLLFIYEVFTIIPFTFNNVSGITYLLKTLNNLNVFLIDISKNTHSNFDNVYLSYDPNIADFSFTNFLQIQALGYSLYTYEAILLLILSIILLLGMVTPIFISKKY